MIANLEKKNMFNIILPHPELRQFVSFYNVVTTETNTFSDKYTLVPNVNETITISYNGKKIAADVWGVSTHSQKIGNEPNRSRCLLLIELMPYGLYKLTGFSQTEFANKRIDLASALPQLFSRLCNAFEAANSIPQLKQLLDEILLDCIEGHELSGELLLAANRIMGNNGTISVKELAQFVNYSERHLNRIFYRQIGVSVKTFTRIIRFNHVLHYLHSGSLSFAELSAQSGFFDQSHFIQDFKAICGVTPDVYMKNMSDFSYVAEQN